MCDHLLCNTACLAPSLPAAAVVLLCIDMSPGSSAHNAACMQLFRELFGCGCLACVVPCSMLQMPQIAADVPSQRIACVH